MVSAYLYFNAALYGAFALWCTLRPGETSRAIGYQGLTAGGESEYRVIYGGLQVGLALFFLLLARRPDLGALGLTFALALYVPIVAYRLATILVFWPVPGTTVAVGLMELVLLLVAGTLFFSAR